MTASDRKLYIERPRLFIELLLVDVLLHPFFLEIAPTTTTMCSTRLTIHTGGGAGDGAAAAGEGGGAGEKEEGCVMS